jgi:DNA-binding transcriptional LysR family regulator
MELRHLRYFVAVAEEAHVTRAAARLGLQQPPLSQQIRALEAEVGTPLFRRGPRGMTLTEAGEAFLPEARAALAAAARATADARRWASGRAGMLRVGFTTSAALHPAVPSLVRAFRQSSEAVRLDVSEGNAAELTERIARGQLDAALLRVVVGRPEGCVATELLREPALLALPADHRALERARTQSGAVRLAELAGERFIVVRRGEAPGLYADFVAACRRAGFEPEIAAEVDRMLTNVNLVAAGVGVSVVPASMRGIHPGQVAYRPIADRPALIAPLTLMHAEEAGPLLRRFAAMAREHAARVG